MSGEGGAAAASASGDAAGGSAAGDEVSTAFKNLSGNVTTAMLLLDNTLHEVSKYPYSRYCLSSGSLQFLQFKDELLKVKIAPI